MPKILDGTTVNLPLLQLAKSRIAEQGDFIYVFIGILSCYVPAEIWEYAVKTAENSYRETGTLNGKGQSLSARQK